MKKRTLQPVLLFAASLPLLQLGGCSLFDGGLLERTLTGAVLNPLTAAVFQQFFGFGAGV